MNVISLSSDCQIISSPSQTFFSALYGLLKNELHGLPFTDLMKYLERGVKSLPSEESCSPELKKNLLRVFGEISARLHSDGHTHTQHEWMLFYHYFGKIFKIPPQLREEDEWYSSAVSLMVELTRNIDYSKYLISLWHDNLVGLLFMAAEATSELQEDEVTIDKFVKFDKHFTFSLLEPELEPITADWLISKYFQNYAQARKSIDVEHMKIYAKILNNSKISTDRALDSIELIASRDLAVDTLEIILQTLLEKFDSQREITLDKFYRILCLLGELKPKLEISDRWKRWISEFSTFFWKELSYNSGSPPPSYCSEKTCNKLFSLNPQHTAVYSMIDLFLQFKRFNLDAYFLMDGIALLFIHMMDENFACMTLIDVLHYLQLAEPLFCDAYGMLASTKLNVLNAILGILLRSENEENDDLESDDGLLILYQQISRTFSIDTDWDEIILDHAEEIFKAPSIDKINSRIKIIEKLRNVHSPAYAQNDDHFHRKIFLAIALASTDLQILEDFLAMAFMQDNNFQKLVMTSLQQARLDTWICHPKFTLEDSIGLAEILFEHCIQSQMSGEKLILGILTKAKKYPVLTYGDLKSLHVLISKVNSGMFTSKVKQGFQELFSLFSQKVYSPGNIIEDFQKTDAKLSNPKLMAARYISSLQELFVALCSCLEIKPDAFYPSLACMWTESVVKEIIALRESYAEWLVRAQPKKSERLHPHRIKPVAVSQPLCYLHLKSVQRLPFHNIKLTLYYILQKAYEALSEFPQMKDEAFETIETISRLVLNPSDKNEPQIVLGDNLTWIIQKEKLKAEG